MRKITRIFCLIMAMMILTSCGTGSQSTMAKSQTVELYFVDSEMLRLVPTEMDVGKLSTKKAAKKVIEELIVGRDYNKKIRRLIPNIKNCMTVKVEKNVAYVNLTKEFVENHPDGRELEVLTIYSIVNSLTSVEGITNVKFTIDGKEEAKFKGALDMRETFIPDYMV